LEFEGTTDISAIKGNFDKPFLDTMEFNKGEKVKFSRDKENMLSSAGGSWILLSNNKAAEGRKAGRASKKQQQTNTLCPLSSRSGSTTVIPLGDLYTDFAFTILHSTTLFWLHPSFYIHF